MPNQNAHAETGGPEKDATVEALRREVADLSDALAEAARTNKGYRDLLLAAAHEMRTPLHAIGLHLEMLARLAGGERESAQKMQIERAKRVLEGYVRRTSMLLDAARLTSGAFTLTTEPVALDAVVGAICELYAAKAKSQQTHIESRVTPAIVGYWDRAAVETILANLVSNALKYGEGAPVTLTGTMDDKGNAVIRVSDTGPGIADNQRSLIFDKFNRAPGRPVVGYGLGLWIANQLAILHGGSVVLEPSRAGASFVVTLRLRIPSPAGSPT
jgi:two-component system OmpR family sensor kinase